jgi:amino acid transporter
VSIDTILHALTLFLAKYLLYLVLLILVLNMAQRRYHRQSQRKRMGTFYLAILVLALMVGCIVIVYFRLPDWLVLPLIAALALLGYAYRRYVFPFRLRCRVCGRPLPFQRILFFDANTHEEHEPKEQQGEQEED